MMRLSHKEFQDMALEAFNQKPDATYRTKISAPGMPPQIIPGATLPDLIPGSYNVALCEIDDKGRESDVIGCVVEIAMPPAERSKGGRPRKSNETIELAQLFERLETERQEVRAEMRELQKLRASTEQTFLQQIANENNARWERLLRENDDRAARQLREREEAFEQEKARRDDLHKLELQLRDRYQATSPSVEREKVKQQTVLQMLQFAEPLKEPLVHLGNALAEAAITKVFGIVRPPISPTGNQS